MFRPTSYNEQADININPLAGGFVDSFTRLFAGQTALRLAVDIAKDFVDLDATVLDERARYDATRYKFDRLGRLPDLDGPRFVFAAVHPR